MFRPEKSEKKKKDKKRAKHKKHEKKRKSSEDDTSSSGDEWVENSVPKIADAQREEWMNSSDFVPTFSKNDLKSARRKERKDEERQLSSLDKPGQHERELNPYWKGGGRGLPTAEEETSKAVSYKTVGDGGVDWLRRAYRRVLDQAKEEGRSAEEVAAERWGSLDRLQAMLKDAEEKVGPRDRRSSDNYGSGSSSYSSRHGRTFQRPRDDRRSFEKPKEYSQPFQKPRENRDDNSYKKSSFSSSSHRDRPRWQKPEFKHSSEASPKQSEEREALMSSQTSEPARISSNTIDQEDHVSPMVSQTVSKPSEPLVETLTKKEMNELGAKIIKAELLGNTELAEKLKARLNSAKEASADEANNYSSKKKEEVVILTQSNARGLVSPLVCGISANSTSVSGTRKKVNKLETHRDGERVCYFQDDSKYTLKQMFEKEKLTTADDETALYLKLAGGKSRLTTDDDFMIDDALLSKRQRRETEDRQAEQQRSHAIREHRKMNLISEKCSFCLESTQMQKHLIVALGSKAYVSLPSCKSLDEGHCYIVPMSHVPAITHVDEDIWDEVQSFRRKITEMFKSQEKDVIFMETSLHLRRHPHAFIECIALPVDLGHMAPMYFKKAILECDTEWAQNKKLVDLSKKDVRHSVPKGLPYFAVDFGMDGGFAHVVEDEQLFPDYFGREILGGMLDLEPRMWQKPLKESFKDQSQKVLEFEKWWKPFDVTSK